jgi:hypothetical protein
MPTSYDGKKLIPLTYAGYTKEYRRSGDGTKIGQIYNIVLRGTIVAYKGSPDSGGNFWIAGGYPPDEVIVYDERLKAIQRKQEAIRCLFSTDGLLLEVTPWDGSLPFKCNPRVKSIEFSEGLWVETSQYTINLEADFIYNNILPNCPPDLTPHIDDATEEWQMEAAEHIDTYRLSHTVSAKGKKFYDETGTLIAEAWQEASGWVLPRLGIDLNRARGQGTHNLSSAYNGYNYTRSQTIDELAGTFQVTETWLVASGVAIEDFTVESRTSANEDLTIVTINGTVTGLESRNNTTWTQRIQEKYSAASGYFASIVEPNLLSRAQTYSGLSMNPAVLEKSIGRNPTTGVITYNYTYNNRPANSVAGSLSDSIEIVDDLQSDVFAVIGVIGRTTGPVLQDLSAKTEKKRTLNIEAKMPAKKYGGSASSEPDVSSIINTYTPNFSYLLMIAQNEKVWNPITGHFRRTIGWVYE